MIQKYNSCFFLLSLCLTVTPTTLKPICSDNLFITVVCGSILTGFATIGKDIVKRQIEIKQQIAEANATITAKQKQIETEVAQINQQVQAQMQLIAEKKRELAQREQVVQKREASSSATRSAAKASDILAMLASVATAQNPYDTNQAYQALKKGVELAYQEALKKNNLTEMVLLQEISNTIQSDQAALNELLAGCQKRATK